MGTTVKQQIESIQIKGCYWNYSLPHHSVKVVFEKIYALIDFYYATLFLDLDKEALASSLDNLASSLDNSERSLFQQKIDELHNFINQSEIVKEAIKYQTSKYKHTDYQDPVEYVKLIYYFYLIESAYEEKIISYESNDIFLATSPVFSHEAKIIKDVSSSYGFVFSKHLFNPQCLSMYYVLILKNTCNTHNIPLDYMENITPEKMLDMLSSFPELETLMEDILINIVAPEQYNLAIGLRDQDQLDYVTGKEFFFIDLAFHVFFIGHEINHLVRNHLKGSKFGVWLDLKLELQELNPLDIVWFDRPDQAIILKGSQELFKDSIDRDIKALLKNESFPKELKQEIENIDIKTLIDNYFEGHFVRHKQECQSDFFGFDAVKRIISSKALGSCDPTFLWIGCCLAMLQMQFIDRLIFSSKYKYDYIDLTDRPYVLDVLFPSSHPSMNTRMSYLWTYNFYQITDKYHAPHMTLFDALKVPFERAAHQALTKLLYMRQNPYEEHLVQVLIDGTSRIYFTGKDFEEVLGKLSEYYKNESQQANQVET